MIVEQIKKGVHPRTAISKPNAKEDFIVKGWERRRGEDALIYFIPNHNDPNRPYQKGITKSEWEKAYQQIMNNGTFSRD
jgi:hypothetical protein